VLVDCSGLTETLFESELFGHEEGSFTGATARKPGAWLIHRRRQQQVNGPAKTPP
jgi:transcriptional regulator with GAF, ATPase, and Fis domain